MGGAADHEAAYRRATEYTRYPNGGVSVAMAELRAEAARIQAAITALEAVTLAKSTQ